MSPHYFSPTPFYIRFAPADDPSGLDAARVRDAIAGIIRDGTPEQQDGAPAGKGGGSSRAPGAGEFAPASGQTTPEKQARPQHSSSSSSSAGPASEAAQLRSRTEAAFGSAGGAAQGSPSSSGPGSAALSAPVPPPMSYAAGVSGGKRAGEGRGEVGVDDVHRAQAEHDHARDALQDVSGRLALGEEELKRATASAERASTAAGGSAGAAHAVSDPSGDRGALDEAMGRIETEERQLYERLAQSDQREIFESFLSKKKELEEEERRLTQTLEEHEETLAQIRQRLANPPQSILPSDPTKARLYVAWKRALADREDLLRQARRRKHELMRNLKERHETQIVLLEMERRAAVEGLQSAVDEEKKKADQYRAELKDLDANIEGAREAMKKFRDEFEQLRVALLIDRMAKSSQVANLAQRRQKLAAEAEQFKASVESARQRVAMEEAAKWEAKLAAEKEAGERMLEEEREKNRRKVEQIKDEMVKTFEEGFRPLLDDAEKRHHSELERVRSLERELEAKEEELRQSQEAARKVAAAPAPGDGGDAADAGGDDAEAVPDWKLQEFEQLKQTVCEMWEQLEVPEEDVTAFLSECDLMAPYHPKVLAMYQEMHSRLVEQDPALTAPAPTPTPAPAPAPAPAPVLEEAPLGGGKPATNGHVPLQPQQHESQGQAQQQQPAPRKETPFGAVGLRSPAAARAAASRAASSGGGAAPGSAPRASASVLTSPIDPRAQTGRRGGRGATGGRAGRSGPPPPKGASMRGGRDSRLTGGSGSRPQDVGAAMAQMAALSGAAPPRAGEVRRGGAPAASSGRVAWGRR